MNSPRTLKSIATSLVVALVLGITAAPVKQAEAGVLVLAAVKGLNGNSEKARMLLKSAKWTGGYAVVGALVSIAGIAGSAMLMAVFFGPVTLDAEGNPTASELEDRFATSYPGIESQAVITDLANEVYANWNNGEEIAEGMKNVRVPAERLEQILINVNPELKAQIIAELQ